MARTKGQKSTPRTRASSKSERSQVYRKPNIHPGRTNMDWKCTAFLSGPEIDDGELFVREEDVYDFKIDFMDTFDTCHHTNMTVSLLDIARPAKQKGAANDFEIVRKVRHVIAMEDDFEGLGYQWEDDADWEQIYDEQHVFGEKRSYSSVLRGNEP